MRLDLLLGDVAVLERRGDIAGLDVSAVAHDTREVVDGALYCCVPGSSVDGHDLALAAVDAGAVALLCQRILPVDVAQVRVERTREAMPLMAATFWGHPSTKLRLVGVTGTNGKTTTTYLLEAIFAEHGWSAGVIGTLDGARTTPEAPELQRRLAGFVADGKVAAAMEVSSHALAQHRVDGSRFEVAAFTNLTQDHLDFHGGMESYFAAKRRLFEPSLTTHAVVNADDAYGIRLLEHAGVPTRAYSMDDASALEMAIDGSRFRIDGHTVHLRLAGSFNVANALCAAAVARVLDIPAATVASGLSRVTTVPGRFDVVVSEPFAVVVDYAHTPAALEEVLRTAHSVARGRVTVVFGCGGDRDRAKRPLMGAIACAIADDVIVTSDNPRHEDPAAIVAEIVSGATSHVDVVPDRAVAIARAIGRARPGDVVVIAGKGHETGQIFGDRTVHFDDHEVALAALADVL